MAMSQPASEANTAIPAIVPDAQDSGDLASSVLQLQMSFAANGGCLSFVYIVKGLSVSMQQAVLTVASCQRSLLQTLVLALQSAVASALKACITVQGI